MKKIIYLIVLAICLFASTSYASAANSYTVKKGDTLYKISKSTGVSVKNLIQYNKIKGTTIYVGQKLRLSSNQTKTVSNTTSYTVKEGDTLKKIAKNYKTTVAKLKKLNNLKNDRISIGQKLIVPKLKKQPSKNVKKEVLAYTIKIYSGDSSSYSSMKKHKKSITSIGTSSYIVDQKGNVKGTAPKNEINFANKNNIRPILLIGNGFDRKVSHAILTKKKSRKTMINQTMKLLKTNKYKGVQLDIENIQPQDRTSYTQFIKEFSKTMKNSHYEFSVAVPAKTADSPKNSWDYAYDYKSIAPYIDYAVIMAYDEHYIGSEPGPVASINWVTKVVNYTKSVIPASKILLGVPSYGYDFGVETTSEGYDDIMDRASKYKARVQFDSTSKTPFIKYTDGNNIKHQIWFENAKSIQYKLQLVKKYNLKGIAIWRIGIEDPAIWSVIDANL